MFSKNQKLTKNEVQELFKTGNKGATKNFLIYCRPNQTTKFCIIIGKKASKKAVDRNYCKRIVSEIIKKEILPQIKKGGDFVLVIKQNLKNVSSLEIRSEINNILKYV